MRFHCINFRLDIDYNTYYIKLFYFRETISPHADIPTGILLKYSDLASKTKTKSVQGVKDMNTKPDHIPVGKLENIITTTNEDGTTMKISLKGESTKEKSSTCFTYSTSNTCTNDELSSCTLPNITKGSEKHSEIYDEEEAEHSDFCVAKTMTCGHSNASFNQSGNTNNKPCEEKVCSY